MTNHQDAAAELERRLAVLPGIARIYPQSIQAAVLHSLATSLTGGRGEGARIWIRDGIVSIKIGTAEGSIARDVAHEVHQTVLEFMAMRNVSVVRVDVTIATIGA